MQQLSDYKLEIQKCSKCGLCQSSCPVFKITKNDCTIPRGQLLMLDGILKNKIKFTKNVKNYLDLCSNCGACIASCPSGLAITEIITVAKHEYFKTDSFEKCLSFLQNLLLHKLILNFFNIFSKKLKSKKYSQKVIYFGGCKSKIKGNSSVVKFLNDLNIEVITPNFNCCGNSMLAKGDLNSYNFFINNFVKILRNYDVKEIVTSCSICEKNLKDYIKWTNNDETRDFLSKLKITCIYKYIENYPKKILIKEPIIATFYSTSAYDKIAMAEKYLENIDNINYKKQNSQYNCCEFNAIANIKNIYTNYKIIKEKRNKIVDSGARYVFTDAIANEFLLKYLSLFKYKVCDLIDFLVKHTAD